MYKGETFYQPANKGKKNEKGGYLAGCGEDLKKGGRKREGR